MRLREVLSRLVLVLLLLAADRAGAAGIPYPVDCIPLAVQGNPYLLDCWLEHTPNVANAISWTFPSRNGAAAFKRWPEWSSSRRSALRQAYVDVMGWRANGMTHFPGALVEDPPKNKNLPLIEHTGFTVLDNMKQAWPIYLGHVALSLATEIHGWVPWSIRDLDDEALNDLLGSTAMFYANYASPNTVYRGMQVLGSVPSNATTVREILNERGLVTRTALATIARVVDWERWNLHHVLGPTNWENLQSYYQYPGAPPIRRVLEGTVASGPGVPDVGHAHWIAGCGGSTRLLEWTLRTVNIPVRQLNVDGHALPYFPSVARHLSHGDDPYSSLAQTPEISARSLLINGRKYYRWFITPSATEAAENVGRGVRELAIQTPSPSLVAKHCQDVLDGKSHATSAVYAIFDDDYALAALEATGLWDRLAERAAGSTDWPCDQLP